MRHPALLSLLLCACASSPLHDPTLTAGPMPCDYLLVDADSPHVRRIGDVRHVPGGSQPFTLGTDRIVNGRTVPAGTVLHGLLEDGSWVRPPQFAEAWFWRTDFAMVKHLGDDHWIRLDLRTGAEERMPFRSLVTTRRHSSANLDEGRVIGLDVDKSDGGLCTVWLLDADWRVAAELPRVVPAELRDRIFLREQSVDLLGKVYVVHHRDESGADVDVVYDLAGKPLSPKLDPLRRLAQDGWATPVQFAIRTEPLADLFWPLHDDGTITPKPAHVAGIKVFEYGPVDRTGRPPFQGGVVIGTVGDEERFALLSPHQWYGQSAIEALAKSNFRAIEAIEYRYTDPGFYDRNTGYSGGSHTTKRGFLVHRIAENDWQIVGMDGRGVVGHGHPTREAACATLAKYNNESDAAYLAESERRRKEYDYAMSWRERRDAAAAAHEKAVRAALTSMQQASKSKDVAAGLELARTLRDRDFAGAEAYVRFVMHSAEQAGAKVPLDDLEQARRITTDPTCQDRLLSSLQRLHPDKYAPAVAAGSGGGSSGGGGSSASSGSGSGSPPVWSGPSVAETLSNARWASQYSYLSGQTSSYWGSNGVNRR